MVAQKGVAQKGISKERRNRSQRNWQYLSVYILFYLLFFPGESLLYTICVMTAVYRLYGGKSLQGQHLAHRASFAQVSKTTRYISYLGK